MQNQVRLEIVEGPLKGGKFEFTEHDTYIFGRAADCHARLTDDPLVSRHHFLLEANPPRARLRDLGRLNATHVNNRKCGGREKGETPGKASICTTATALKSAKPFIEQQICVHETSSKNCAARQNTHR